MPGSVVRVDRYTQRIKDAGCGSQWTIASGWWSNPADSRAPRCDGLTISKSCRCPAVRLGETGRSVCLRRRGFLAWWIPAFVPMPLPCSAGRTEFASPALPGGEEKMRFSELLRISRARTGLTFRVAHGLTRAIAQILGDPEYAIALGLLSDYEAMSKLPRHIAKIHESLHHLLHGCSGLDAGCGSGDRRFREIASAPARSPCSNSP